MLVGDHLARVIGERPEDWTGSPQLLADLAADLLAARARLEQLEAAARDSARAAQHCSHLVAASLRAAERLPPEPREAMAASLKALVEGIDGLAGGPRGPRSPERAGRGG